MSAVKAEAIRLIESLMMSGNLDWHESDLQQPVVPSPRWKPNSKMALEWIVTAFMVGGSLIAGWAFSFMLFFSPGWANGWPFGLSFQLVTSFAMTCVMSLMLMAAAAAVGALFEVVVALAGVTEERQWQVYRWWLWLAAVVVLCLSIWGFRKLYDWTWKQFPDGYVITQAEQLTPRRV
jgi:hypothetical protein